MHSGSGRTRWVQLLLGLIVMMTISSPQYVWTLFTKPLAAATGASLPALQVTFTLLIVLQTFFSPVQGWLIERVSAKVMIAFGAALSGLGWVAASRVEGLWGLYATYGLLCGLGTGIVYVGVVGLMVRWFPERRGFATGIVAAGYGLGAMLTTFPVTDMMAAQGHRHTLLVFGLILGGVGALAALGLRTPSPDEVPAIPQGKVASAARDTAPAEMLRTPLFWLMFAMFTMMSTGGLMVVANFANFARAFGVADMLVFGMAALPFALTFDRITNGLTRPFFGWISDRYGRENTMAGAFALEACAILLLLALRENAYAFALLSGLVFFAWGEIFSLFPSTLTDTFGARHATTNYGFLYMAQGVGSLLGGPAAAALHDWAGSWIPVFCIAIAFDLITAALAWFVLKPARRLPEDEQTAMAAGPFSFGDQPDTIEGWCRLATRSRLAACTLIGAKLPGEAWTAAGYTVEYALKAAVMTRHRFNRFPSRELRPDLYTHNLAHLAREAGIDFKGLVRDPVAAHFQTVLLWKRSEAYNPNAMPMRVAEDMIEAAFGPNGVIQWLATRYHLTI